MQADVKDQEAAENEEAAAEAAETEEELVLEDCSKCKTTVERIECEIRNANREREAYEAANPEGVLADRKKRLEAITKAVDAYSEAHPELLVIETELREFSSDTNARVTDVLGEDGINEVRLLVDKAVAAVEAKREERKEQQAAVKEAKETADAKQANYASKKAALEKLSDLKGTIEVRLANLEKMKKGIADRLDPEKTAEAQYGTVYWLLTQQDQGKGEIPLLNGTNFFDGLIDDVPKLIDPKKLAAAIDNAWKDEAKAKVESDAAATMLKKAESGLKAIEKKLDELASNLTKSITEHIESWDRIRDDFADKEEE